MKHTFVIINLLLMFILCCSLNGQEKNKDTQSKGAYLGQKLPGMVPEIFAPGIISKPGYNEGLLCTYLDGNNLILFTRSAPDDKPKIYYQIYVTEYKNGVWVDPYVSDFHNQPCDTNLSLIPGDKNIYFGSRRSKDGKGESLDGFNIWMVKKIPEGFSNPRMIEFPVSSADYDICPTMTQDGTIYFFSERKGGLGRADIYRSQFINGHYPEVENIGAPINTENSEIDPLIAQDESYLISCSRSLEGFGDMDLFISFRKNDNTWSEPINMGEGINSSSNDWIPCISLDNNYFFFTSNRSGDYEIYWVDAKIIEELKPDELK